MQRAKRIYLNSFVVLSLTAFGCGSTQTSEVDGDESLASVESQLKSDNGTYSVDVDEAYAFNIAYLKNLDLTELDWSQLDALPLPEFNTDLANGEQASPPPPKEGDDGPKNDDNGKPCNSTDVDGDAATDSDDGQCNPEAPADCPHGHLWGKYKSLAKGVGILRAVAVGRMGKKVGFLKGVYGHGVFFGKYINLEGKPVGVVAGKYADGEFEGAILGHEGAKGRIRGKYENGRLKARWKLDCSDREPLPPIDPNERPDQCFAEVLGDDTSCKPFDTWTQYAKEICDGDDYRVVGLSIAEPCDKGSFRRMKVECCRDLKTDKPEDGTPNCNADHEGNSSDGKPEDCTGADPKDAPASDA